MIKINTYTNSAYQKNVLKVMQRQIEVYIES